MGHVVTSSRHLWREPVEHAAAARYFGIGKTIYKKTVESQILLTKSQLAAPMLQPMLC